MSTSLSTKGVWPPFLSAISACSALWREWGRRGAGKSSPLGDSVAVRDFKLYFIHFRSVSLRFLVSSMTGFYLVVSLQHSTLGVTPKTLHFSVNW
jgi:hypothetical protein